MLTTTDIKFIPASDAKAGDVVLTSEYERLGKITRVHHFPRISTVCIHVVGTSFKFQPTDEIAVLAVQS